MESEDEIDDSWIQNYKDGENKFINNAMEIDVDAISDGKDVIISGIMEHIEEAGIHSGDSTCTLPPYSLSDKIIQDIKKQTRKLAIALKVKGFTSLLSCSEISKTDIILL